MIKKLALVASTATLAAMLVIAASTRSEATYEQDPPPDPGGGGQEKWYRNDYPCPNPEKEKTYCLSGGHEQCTAQYCQ